MTKKPNITINDVFLKVLITCLAASIYFFCIITDSLEIVLFPLIAYEVWIGYKMCTWEEYKEYGYDMVSALCCVVFNVLFYFLLLEIENISGQPSPVGDRIIYILIVLISVGAGYKIGKSRINQTRKWADGKGGCKNPDGVKEDQNYTTWREYYEKKYKQYSDIHDDYDSSDSKEEYSYSYNRTENNSRSRSETRSSQANTSYRSNYFNGCKTNEEIKKRYKDLCKKYHPDNRKTGDEEVFKEIRAQYDELNLSA